MHTMVGKRATITLTEDELAIISRNATKRVSRKQFINSLCELGWSRKSAKEEAKKTNGHYGTALAYYKLNSQSSIPTREKLLRRFSSVN